MGKGGSAGYTYSDFSIISSLLHFVKMRSPLDSVSVISRLKVATFITLWFVFSVASLFLAKHVLHVHRLNEAVFTLWQFALSVIFGLIFTKIFRVQTLASLSAHQFRSIVPLSVTFLVKELLKYAALSRVSVNLVNTIRSLGPIFNVLLEYLFLGHIPQRSILYVLIPIVIGVALTSIDEIHVASVSNSLFVALVGFLAAVFSTAINIGQNIYSKILFGREKIDPVSLQIFLSAISFLLMSPFTLLQLGYQSFRVPTASHFLAPPATPVFASLVLAGFVNFVASQLAFNTLRLVSPLSYSVANTFKRVAIAVIAIVYFSERLSTTNALGISVSIIGIFFYERRARALRQARQYALDSTITNLNKTQILQPLSSLPARKQNLSGPDLKVLDQECSNITATPTLITEAANTKLSDCRGTDPVQRHLYVDVDVATSSPRPHAKTPLSIMSRV